MSNIPLEFDLQTYNFELDESKIAQVPAQQRQQSKLLVLDRKSGLIQQTDFYNLPDFLPADSLLVANNTKVLPARLIGRKATGGKVEFLLLTPLALIKPQPAVQMQQAEVSGLLKASKTPKAGDILDFGPDLQIEVLSRADFGQSKVRLIWQGSLEHIFSSQGHIPLPPYIRREDKPEDQDRYQTIYCKQDKLGSVAAPTAGLHFTPALKQKLLENGQDWAEVTLYVGYGTFSPIRVRDIRRHDMHKEYIEVSTQAAAKINQAKDQGRPIVAVGTTTVRTLESMFQKSGQIGAYQGWTNLFISPGYEFKVIDHLITNFHLPGSSLIIMVSALAGIEPIQNAYKYALNNDFRFFSYGDAMLIK